MHQTQREFVRKNYVKLTKAISPNVEEVVVALYNENVISQHMKDNIIEGNITKQKKTWALLDLIVTRGPNALDFLYNAVLAEQLFEAADILKPENSPHLPPELGQPQQGGRQIQLNQVNDYDSPDEGLPDSWPSEEAIDAYKTARLVEEKHTIMRKLFEAMHTPRGQEFTYLMSAKPRGQVLIINNEEFDKMPHREGTLADRKSLEKLFDTLNFDVRCEKNKKKEEMWQLLVTEAKRKYHETAQCFVLFILSHGHTGVVFGTDGYLKDGHPQNCLEIKDIVDLFCKSKALQGKPKLFFIQACQGAAKNVGHPVGQTDASDSSTPQNPAATAAAGSASMTPSSSAGHLSDEDNSKEQEKLVLEAKTALDEVLSSTQADAYADKIPSGADVFVALATVPGFLSYRNTRIGTWFIQAISYVFAKYAYKYDLNKLMTRVNNLVGRAEIEKGRYKQVCEKKDSFQKDFYFFPGLFDSK
ncbi:hypothetical protein BsWGS_26629 [Bradybaena similaris]